MVTLTDDFLAQNPLFAGTTEKQREELLQVMTREHYRTGREIIRAGGQAEGLHLIIAGAAEVLINVYSPTNPCIPDDKPQLIERAPVGRFDVGDVFGEVSFFSDGSHSATVRATANVELLTLSRKAFEDLLKAGNKVVLRIGFNAAQLLAQRLRTADKTIEELAQRTHDGLLDIDLHDHRATLFGKPGRASVIDS